MNMAASSSSSSAAPKEYDVFISFRGEDTRYNFTSHLVSALSRNSIKAYVDYELKKGDEISSSLIKAIHDSYGSLIVFSENYASSKWCLNELLQILECRKQGHFVIPVFYNTDPSCVRKQTGSYGQAFAIHEQDSRNKEKLKSWKAALTEAANIVGWDTQSPTNRPESELIENIVNDIVQRMGHIYQPSQSSFVGMDRYCEEIESLLQRSLVVGIWGMGGVGKTTIAKVIFDKLYSQYDSSCFFENVREESEKKGKIYIRNKLLSELLKDENFLCGTTKPLALNFAMRRLSNKRVLIVLDDVNHSNQLEYLQQEYKRLRVDSRVIITARDKSVLNGFRNCHEIYEVQGLNFGESLHLFRLNAFNENNLEIEYKEITNKVVNYANGNPLALKVLGSFLFSKSKEEWESALVKLQKFPNNEIQEVLRLSYDELDHSDQQIFLDIACFLKGKQFEDVISLLDGFGFYGRIGMRTLQDKALVTILSDKRVHMHDLLQEMGHDIVCKESIKTPEKRSRLWDSEAYDVLINNKGTNTIEGIKLNLSQSKDLSLKFDTFKKMTSLRFVEFYSTIDGSCKVDLLGGIELPSKILRYLCWDRYPLPSLPTNLCAEQLVILRMPGSNITKLWDGLQNIENLKEIDLGECTELIELPDFSKASKLEGVVLKHCSNLCHVHPSLLHLDTLARLDVSRCEKLRSLESDRHLKSLKTVKIEGCSSLKQFSLSSDKIEYLDLDGTAIEPFPTSLGHCKNLKYLEFYGPLKQSPSEMSELRSLEFPNINGAKALDSLVLPISFDALPHLEKLRVWYFSKLFQLPHNISKLSSLKALDLRGSSVKSLPKSIKHLSCLQHLDVSHCQRLQSLSELPQSIETLWAESCPILETIIPSTSLRNCDLRNCVKLDEQLLSCLTACARHRVKQENPIVRFWFFLPRDRGLWWFPYWTRETTISIVLPPRSDLLGFVFGIYLGHELVPSKHHILNQVSIGCECYLEYNDIEKCLIADCKGPEFFYEWMPNDVYLWIYECDSFRANGSVSFQFYLIQQHHKATKGIIKGCGVWPVYASELELESSDNAKGNRCELESFEHQGIEVGDLDHENQDEQIPPKLLREFTFPSLSTECKMLNNNNETFDFFKELELGDKSKKSWCQLEVDEQLFQTKKFKESTLQPVPMRLELELNTKSYPNLDNERIQVGSLGHEKQNEQDPLCTNKGIQGIEIEDSDHESQDKQESLLIHKQVSREFIFKPRPTKSKMLNYNNEAFNFFKEFELGDTLKRCRSEPEGSDQPQLSLSKKFKESTLVPVPPELELELNTKSYSNLEIEGIQVRSSDHEKQDMQEPLSTDKGIQGI